MEQGNPSLIRRIAIGKLIGLLFGFIAFMFLSLYLPHLDWMFRWGILLWYVTVGSMIGAFGVVTYHNILRITMPWWFRAPFIGAWMNFVLTFFAYDTVQSIMIAWFDTEGMWSTVFWFTLEGALVGLLIGYLSTRYGVVGSETVGN